MTIAPLVDLQDLLVARVRPWAMLSGPWRSAGTLPPSAPSGWLVYLAAVVEELASKLPALDLNPRER